MLAEKFDQLEALNTLSLDFPEFRQKLFDVLVKDDPNTTFYGVDNDTRNSQLFMMIEAKVKIKKIYYLTDLIKDLNMKNISSEKQAEIFESLNIPQEYINGNIRMQSRYIIISL